MAKFKYTSPMQVPKLEDCLEYGVGDVKENPKAMEAAVNDMALISGQKTYCNKGKSQLQHLSLGRNEYRLQGHLKI